MVNWYLSLIVFIPILGAVILALFEQLRELFKRWKINTDTILHVTANIFALVVLGLALYSIKSTDIRQWFKTEDTLLGYGAIESILVTLFAFIVWLSVLFSVDYMKNKEGLGYYYALIMTLLTGLTSIVMASNYFTFFVAWELMALSSYALVSFERNQRGAVEASLKYFVMSTAGSLLILLATALTYGVYGDISFSYLSENVFHGNNITALIVALYIIGFGVTASVIFLNAWLPDAHSNAPSTISALLSGIVVKAGAYAIYRTLYWSFMGYNKTLIRDTSLVISWLAILTMFEGNLMVLAQFRRKDIIDIKRILAYSTTVHLGYVLFGIGAGTELGLESSILHIITHAIGKGSLFLLSGSMIAAVGSRDLRKMKGLGRRSPVIGITITIGLLSLGGIPITGGFVSKLMVILSALNGNHPEAMNIALVILATINSILALGGYLYLLKYVLFDKPEDESKVRVPLFETIVLTIMSLALIVIGLWPTKLFTIIESAVTQLKLFI